MSSWAKVSEPVDRGDRTFFSPKMRYNSHLFHFTCLVLCLARVVVSSRKRKSTAITLRDTHNNVEAVQLRGHSSSAMVLVPPRNHVIPLTKYSIPYMLQKWMDEGEYGKIVELCDKGNGGVLEVCLANNSNS